MNLHAYYLTPDELVHKYPQVESLGWNASKIGIFFSAHLLNGNWNRHANKAFINELSLIELMEYTNAVSAKRTFSTVPSVQLNNNYLTPQELVEFYPQIIQLKWGSIVIGMFFNSGLLLGHRNGKDHKALIVESSFIDLVNYVNYIELKYQIKL